MNENLKKGLLIAVVIIALALAGWQVTKTVGGSQPHVEAEAKVEPGHKSEKQLALEAQSQGGGDPKAASSDADAQAKKEAALAGN